MHRHILRRIYAKPYLIAFDTQHRHRNIIPDHHGFTDSSRQY
jgi:hypothetical protein